MYTINSVTVYKTTLPCAKFRIMVWIITSGFTFRTSVLFERVIRILNYSTHSILSTLSPTVASNKDFLCTEMFKL